MFKVWNKKVKRFNYLDVGLVKWSVVAGTLFLLTVWPWLHTQVMRVHWGIYLAAMILLALKPMIKFWGKK